MVETIQTIDSKDLKARLKKRERLFLLDVRERDEFKSGHLSDSINIPIGTIVAGVQDEKLPKDRTIVTICAHGFRSGRAQFELAKRGFTALSLAGGVEAWVNAGGKLE